MQNEEKSKLEQRIIQYFDGSLGSEESKSLLSDVGKSAESRALFKGHETLQRLISAARVPMEMPMEAKRSIADRIPGLLAFIPGLLGGAEAVPVITQSANPFIAFLTRIPLSTAISVGASAVVLTTAGVIIKNNLDGNAAFNQKAKIAVVQNSAATTGTQAYAQLPKSNGAIREARHANTAYSELKRQFAYQSLASGIADRTNLAQQQSNDASNDHIEIVAPAAPRINAEISPRPTHGVTADIPVQSGSIFSPNSESFGEGITVRSYASIGERIISVPGINGPGYSKNFQNTVFGLEFELGDHYAFRVQGGSSTFAQVTYVQSDTYTISPLPVKKPDIEPLSNKYWTTMGMSYEIPVTPSIPVTLSGDVGAVWLAKTGLIGILGLSTEIPIMPQLALRPTLTYDAVWTPIAPPPVASGNAIYQNIINQSSMLTGAFGLQFNLMYRF